jgi:hypothetical protein
VFFAEFTLMKAKKIWSDRITQSDKIKEKGKREVLS